MITTTVTVEVPTIVFSVSMLTFESKSADGLLTSASIHYETADGRHPRTCVSVPGYMGKGNHSDYRYASIILETLKGLTDVLTFAGAKVEGKVLGLTETEIADALRTHNTNKGDYCSL